MFAKQYFFCLRKVDQILATTSEAKLNLFPTAQDKKPFCPLRVLRVTLGGEIVWKITRL